MFYYSNQEYVFPDFTLLVIGKASIQILIRLIAKSMLFPLIIERKYEKSINRI